jgi:hypothetical protein
VWPDPGRVAQERRLICRAEATHGCPFLHKGETQPSMGSALQR